MTDTNEQTTTLSAAWAQAPRACPDQSCAAGHEHRIGLVMRAYRPLAIAAITPDEPSAVQFFWTCGACGLRWGHPARPLASLFLETLKRVSPERTVQAGGTETIALSGLAELVACVPGCKDRPQSQHWQVVRADEDTQR